MANVKNNQPEHNKSYKNWQMVSAELELKLKEVIMNG